MKKLHATSSVSCTIYLQCISFLLLVPSLGFAISDSKCILFNFGDSNTDTGGLTAGLGFYLGPPVGQQFFHTPSGRFCNGRLYIDFICESLNINFLSHYLESSGSDYTHGVNFAVAGAATEVLGCPFSFPVQASQFGHFQNKTRELRPKGKGSMISEKEFRNAVYTIDMGQCDLIIQLLIDNRTFQQYVTEKIPVILERIENTTKSLYKLGARKFWLYNTGPMGCLPQTLSLRKTNTSQLDEAGCLVFYNNAAKAFNNRFKLLCDKMRSEMKDATIVLTDMYSIKYDLFANPSKYGFENPLMACCGFGGPPFNYVPRKTCGQPMAKVCADPSRSVSWDGVQYTEAANAIVASEILSGKYSRPHLKLNNLCTHQMY